MLAAVALLTIESCRSLKKDNTAAVRTDTTAVDTSQSELSMQFDSLTNKVGSFLESLLPPKQDTGRVVLTPPRPENESPVATDELPRSDGFLNTPIQREVEFDSLGNVIEKDVFLGGDVNDPLTRSFNEYIAMQRDRALVDGFRKSAAGHINDTTGAAGSGGWFNDYTQINIPIPPSIVPTIFGKPSLNLRVSGDVAVHLAYRDNQFLATTGGLFSGSETGLNFKQEINVSTNGTIGDKLKIGADWGSSRSFQFENLMKLGYQGYPDEILQSIEAGNVNLQTPSQYIGTQQALFGLKAVTRFGPAYVTTLAAQKKGDRQTRSFGGGAGGGAAQETIIRPANYRRNSFFLDSTFIPNFEKYYSTVTPDPANIGNGPVISDKKDVEVWRSTDNLTEIKRRAGVAHYDLGALPSGGSYGPALRNATGVSDLVMSGLWVKLDTNQYSVNENTGVLSLSQEPSDEQAIAVRYKLRNNQEFGESQTGDGAIVLKLIKPKYLFKTPQMRAWKNLLKNTYYIGASNVDLKDFNIRIVYNKPGGDQIEIVRSASGVLKVISALGLDRANNGNPADLTPDGLIDVPDPSQGVTGLLDRRTGTLIFPYLEPFGRRVLQYFDEQNRRNSKVRRDETFYFPELYTTSADIVRGSGQGSQKFFKNGQISIRPKFSGGVSSTLNLNAFNIVDGSVKVNIGGRQLQENVDYRVDYNSGTVTLLKPDLISTGQVSVDYETHDIFTTSTKTVLGFRTEVPILDRGLFGVSLMNFSMRLPSLKTRQGEEPLSNWIAGIDASYNLETPFVTTALNYLPFFNLREKSHLAFKTDFALSMPNPNTQESPIPSDNGASIAYLDDFEGGKNEFPLYSSYGRWVHASQPIESYESTLAPEFRADVVNSLKGKTNWFEVLPQDVPIKAIKPNRSTQRASEPAQVLDVRYDPRTPGAYNHTPSEDLNTYPFERRWGGLMQYAPGLNVPATNTDAVEFWMNVVSNGDNPNGVIRFNLGRISEDVIPDRKLQTEDRNGNGRYDPGEDVGLDTMSNEAELEAFPTATNLGDPSRDDYFYDAVARDRSHINGTQGNQNDRANSLRPDTEDLDANTSVNLDNSYFEYEIPINPVNNPYVVGRSEGDKNWYQYRVPLSEFKRIVGVQDSSFSNVAYYRFWFTGFDKAVHVRLHEVSLVGSQWTRGARGLSLTNPIADTSLRISYVNIEENAAPPTNYREPPGAQRDRLAGQTNYILGNEQSLNMSLNCVSNVSMADTVFGANAREAIRVFQSPNDIFNYRSMAVYVHGGEDRPLDVRDTNNQVWVYVRFGTDDFNYYEYRRPLQRDWQNVRIDFARLTSLKASRASNAETPSEPANDGVPGSRYSVVGSPTLTNAPVFTMGVENRTADNCLTTSVWWDELRLLDANDKTDFAMNASTQLKLAEFGRITASIVNERPDFHRVDERFNPTRTLNFNWNVTGEFLIQKMLPKSMENTSVIPITVAHSETIYRPKYLPNTDVEIESALQKIDERLAASTISPAEADRLRTDTRLSNETVTIKNSFGATGVSLQFPGSFFLLPAFVNRLKYGFGYGEEFSRSPQFEYNRAWSWIASIDYELPTLPKLSYDPLTWMGNTTFFVGPYANWKLNFLPNTVRFGVSATRGRNHSLNRLSTLQFPPNSTFEDSIDVLRSRVPFINRLFTATRGMAVKWKLSEGGLLSPNFDYGLDVTSNLAPLETFERYKFGPEFSDSVEFHQRGIGAILDDIFLKDGKLVNPGRDFVASQRLSMTTTPRLPSLFGIEKIFRPIFSYSVDYRWQDAQTNQQNSKQGSWRNTISTGLELNVRELGVMIFGKPIGDEPPGRGTANPRSRRDRRLEVDPEDVRDPAYSERELAPPVPREEPRNQVERGEEFRPQRRRHPIEGGTQLLDTLNRATRTGAAARIDTSGRVRIPGVGTGGERNNEWASDTVLTPVAPPTPEPELAEEEDPITLQEILQKGIQKPLFDWNGTRFNFTQNNSSQNAALQGSGSGISNFLIKGLFVPEEDGLGPSRAYQLGLISDPHGRLLVKFKPQFPFVEFDVRNGNREASRSGIGMDVTDVFNQQNNFELTTSRPLWEGASLNINWKLGFSYDQRNTLRLNGLGVDSLIYYAKSGDVTRTFLSIPELPFLNILQSGIQKVGRTYQDKIAQEGVADDSLLSPEVRNRLQRESFMEGFESIPMFAGFLREYLPRLNYSFSWSGLEKFFLFSFADRASFRHGYNGNYRRNFRQNLDDPGQLTTLQTISYGFRPLIALDMGWDDLYGGRLNTSMTYDTQTDWGSDYSSQRITRRLSTSIGVTANYQRQGLSIPFLGLDLKNDFGATFTFSKTLSDDSYYTFNNIITTPEGIGNGGLSKTTIEPRVSYTISQQLSIEGFYRYEKTEPSATGQLSPPTRLIMAGIDVRLKIQ